MRGNFLDLNRFFTKKSILELIHNNSSSIYDSVINSYLSDEIKLTHGSIIEKLYNYIKKHYRNEYFFKSTLFNKLLLGRHSLNTTTALSEISIGRSKADFILINGKAVVYEIKSPLDNLERIDLQIQDYYKAFNHVCVISSDDKIERLLKKFEGTPVGVSQIPSKGNIVIRDIKKTENHNNELEHKSLFKVLRKQEYENILLKYYKELPITKPVFYYNECQELFMTIPIGCAYQLYLAELKQRNKINNITLFKTLPREMNAIAYFARFNDNDIKSLIEFSQSKY